MSAFPKKRVFVEKEEDEDADFVILEDDQAEEGDPPSGGGDSAELSLSFPASELPGIRADLLAFFDAHARVLPWRTLSRPMSLPSTRISVSGDERQRIAYGVWVSEVMLQQTRVATVETYWPRWMERFPSVAALASASLDEVNALWQGLGYYRRARLLHAGAAYVISALDGLLPDYVRGLRTIPGIGAYTAGAVASIAFGVPSPIVDGNVERVIARLFACDTDLTRGAGQRALWKAAEWVDEDRPGDFNQAVMELGATVCLPKGAPLCARCPLASRCAARRAGDPQRYPWRAPKTARREADVAVVIATVEEHVLVRRRPDTGLLAGMWEFPNEEAPRGEDAAAALRGRARRAVPGGEIAEKRRFLGEYEHVFSHVKHHVRVEAFELPARPLEMLPENTRWVREDELAEIGVSTQMKKAWELYLQWRRNPELGKEKAQTQKKISEFFAAAKPAGASSSPQPPQGKSTPAAAAAAAKKKRKKIIIEEEIEE